MTMAEQENALERIAERKTTVWKLFHKPFCCETAHYELVSDKEVEKFGTFTTGDRSMDAARARMPSRCWLTINQMNDIFQHGGYFRLINYTTDVRAIHDLIQAYLQEFVDWQREKDRGGLALHDADRFRAVGDYCRQLDDLGKMIHGRASSRRIKREPAKVLSAHDLLKRSFFDRVAETDQPKAPDYVPITERVSYAALGKKKRY